MKRKEAKEKYKKKDSREKIDQSIDRFCCSKNTPEKASAKMGRIERRGKKKEKEKKQKKKK